MNGQRSTLVNPLNQYAPLFTTIPTDRQVCWDRLAAFARFWHRVDCPPLDYTRTMLETEARLHITLPDALVEWHTRFARFINLWSDRSFTTPMNRLAVEDGRLIIRTESVFNGMLTAKWGIPLTAIESDDPPVDSILGLRVYPCAQRVSQFAIYCGMFDTLNSRHLEAIACDNDAEFPAGGMKMEFPESFGIIKTEFYEGLNWIAMASGTDWYLRRHLADDTEQFIKHELRTKGLPP